MDERAIGLVLRTYSLTESSLIVHWLTKEHGRIATVAKGARRPKSSFRGKIDLFFLCDISFISSRKSELHTLKEVIVLDAHPAFRKDLVLLKRVSHAATLITRTTETDTPVPELFDLFDNFLRWSAANVTSADSLPVFAFEVKLLHALGLSPDPTQTNLTPGSRRLLQHLMEVDWSNLSQLKLSRPQSAELSAFFHGFLIYHLGERRAQSSRSK